MSEPTREELIESLTDHWTQLLATAYQHHIITHGGPLTGAAEDFRACHRRVCHRAHEVAAVPDRWFGLQAKADAVNVEMNAALHAFAETLPDDSEPVS